MTPSPNPFKPAREAFEKRIIEQAPIKTTEKMVSAKAKDACTAAVSHIRKMQSYLTQAMECAQKGDAGGAATLLSIADISRPEAMRSLKTAVLAGSR